MTTLQQIQYAKVSQYLAADDNANGALWGERITPDLHIQLYLERKAVEWLYDLSPNDVSLIDTGNYLYSLLGRYGLRAKYFITIGGSGSAAISPTVRYEWNEVSFVVDGTLNSPVAGSYTFQYDDLIGATDLEKIVVNNNIESRRAGDFTIDYTTGTITRINPYQTNDVLIIGYNKIV
jgi:hypothetical protein